jgi:nitrite reductase (NADH) small subunit
MRQIGPHGGTTKLMQLVLHLLIASGSRYVHLKRTVEDWIISMTAVKSQYNLGQIVMIPEGEGRVYEIGLLAIAVFRTKEGKVYATQALCPHREGPLVDGIIGAGEVVCPLHSFKFDLETGTPIGNECPALESYPVSLTDSGDILLSLDGQVFEA